MIEFAALTPAVQALVLVGIVLLEAVVLYVGYGAAERVATPVLTNALEDG